MALGFIAVTYTGSGQLPHSYDGITWAGPTTAVSAGAYGVAYAPSLGVAVAPAHGAGSVAYSADGLNWTTHSCPSANWLAVCWSPQLALFVAVGESSPYVMTSTDGVTWTSRTAPAGSWHAVCWSPQLALFVAVGNVSSAVMTSTDGVTWTNHATALPNAGTWRGVCWSPQLALFVATQGSPSGSGLPAGAVIATSSDGTSFFTVATNMPGHLGIWSASKHLFVVPNPSASSGDPFWTSPDGVTWTGRTAPSSAPLSVAFDEDAGVFVAVGQPGGQPLYSSNGISWSAASGMDITRQWRHVIGCNIIPPTPTFRRTDGWSVGMILAN